MRLDTPLESGRLLLRTLTSGDADGVYLKWFQNPDTLRFLEARFTTHTRESIDAYISAMNESPTDLHLGIFLKDSGKHIGNIKLLDINPNYLRADVGLVIGDESERGNGFGTEAIETVVSYAGTYFGLHRAVAVCHVVNPGSYGAFIKAGFEEEGRLRHHDRIDGEWVDAFILGRILS